MVTLADLQEQIEKKLGKGIEISNHYYDCELRRVVVSSAGPGRRDEDASATLLASSSEFMTSETCTLIDDLGLQDGDEVSVKVILSRPRARYRAVDHLQFTIHGKHYTLPEPITTVYELRQWIQKLSGIHVSQQGDLVGCNTTRDYTAAGGYGNRVSIGLPNRGYKERYRVLDQLGIQDGETFHCLKQENTNTPRRFRRLRRRIFHPHVKHHIPKRDRKIPSSVLSTGSIITIHTADGEEMGAQFLRSDEQEEDPASVLVPSCFDSSTDSSDGNLGGSGLPSSSSPFYEMQDSLWKKVTQNEDPTKRKQEVQKVLETIQSAAFQKFCTNRETIEAMRKFFLSSPHHPVNTSFFASLPNPMKEKMQDTDEFFEMITASMEQLAELDVDELIDVIDQADEQRQKQQQQQQQQQKNQSSQQPQNRQQNQQTQLVINNTNDERMPTTTTTIRAGGPPTLRFQLNQRVECNMGEKYGWRKGRIIKLWMEVNKGRWVPYGVELDDGGGTFAPNDHDGTIRAFTGDEDDNTNTSSPMTLLRFELNQRVTCNMGEKYGWRKGRINKLWLEVKKGRWVPYGIELDDGGETYAPIDHDETICAITNDGRRIECDTNMDRDRLNDGNGDTRGMGDWLSDDTEDDDESDNIGSMNDSTAATATTMTPTEDADVFEDVLTEEVLSSILEELSESENEID